MNNLMSIMITGIAYFIFNRSFFDYVAKALKSKKRAKAEWLTFIINYLFFTVASLTQLHLILNWSLFFSFLLIEIMVIERCHINQAICLSLMGVLIGLSVNILFRSLFAIFMQAPLAYFDNQVMGAQNLKRYPVMVGFVVAGLLFWILNKKQELSLLMEDHASLRFLNRLLLVFGPFLLLNLLAYDTWKNIVVLKLWGIKSSLFVLGGLVLGTFYIIQESKAKRFQDSIIQMRHDLMKQREVEEQTAFLAYTDPLTSCANRQYALKWIQEKLEQKVRFELVFIDLNDLKQVNDRRGHLSGDLYLQTTARFLKEQLPKREAICRYGGDEFLILLQNSGKEQIDMALGQVNQALQGYSQNYSNFVDLSVSWGYATSDEAQQAAVLIELADHRMYQQKQQHHFNKTVR